MNISLTNKEEQYIADLLLNGNFQNASEVVGDALCLHEIYRNMVWDELRSEINKGWDGPTSKRSVRDIIKAKAIALFV